MEEYDLLRLARPEDRALVGVNRATWSRWLRGRSRVPLAVLNLFRIVVAGELPQGGDAWAGWRMVGGRLIDPAGIEHTPGTIQAWHWTRQELQGLRAKENTETPDDLPSNVIPLPTHRRAHQLTAELYRRLDSVTE